MGLSRDNKEAASDFDDGAVGLFLFACKGACLCVLKPNPPASGIDAFRSIERSTKSIEARCTFRISCISPVCILEVL